MRVVTDADTDKNVFGDPEHLIEASKPIRDMLLSRVANPDGQFDIIRTLTALISHTAVHIMKLRQLEAEVLRLKYLLAQNGISPGISQPLKVDLGSSPLPIEGES